MALAKLGTPALALLLAGMFVLLAATPLEAGRRARGYGLITVQSNFTADTATAPVRRARYGWEVRLPSGMWIPCEFNCHYTLRNNTVDFWERFNQNANGR